jgi:putative mRNA 3-end processing factor
LKGEKVPAPLVELNENGLYCEAGDFYIDPWRPVGTALITHAHSDHARFGSEKYISTLETSLISRMRFSKESDFQTLAYGEKIRRGNVWISFHPAGHILGSSQIRLESGSQVWVISGDYKRNPDPTCEAFEIVECDTFITEATFGLPIYQWQNTTDIAKNIMSWWSQNKEQKKASLLLCYSLGKSQRVLAELSKLTDQPVYVHGAVENINKIYRESGVSFLETKLVGDESKDKKFAGELILAPPSAENSVWTRRFGDYSSAFASGWMRVRGAKRRRGFDQGFVISDHADWNSLILTIKQTKAKNVLVTHGNSFSLVKYLNESGRNAASLETQFNDENTQ